ncbi:hypothetical protein BRADI_5g12912v3, partial [Brachypodium distachyon]
PTQTSFSSVSSQRSRDPREPPAAAEVLLLPVSSFSSGPFTPRLPPLSPLFLDLRRSPADRGLRRRRPGDWLRRRQSPAAHVGKNSKTIGDFHPICDFPSELEMETALLQASTLGVAREEHTVHHCILFQRVNFFLETVWSSFVVLLC